MKGNLTKTLASIGTVLVWLPLLAPILLAVIMVFVEGRFLFDFLMPAELFLLALIGGGLLLWAARHAHSYGKLIGGSLGAAVGCLFGVQALAVATGLANGDHEAEGWRLMLVTSGLGLYVLALVFVALGGILLLREAFRTQEKNPPVQG
jgi:hypothetical protein